jgi:hypothetical protein
LFGNKMARCSTVPTLVLGCTLLIHELGLAAGFSAVGVHPPRCSPATLGWSRRTSIPLSSLRSAQDRLPVVICPGFGNDSVDYRNPLGQVFVCVKERDRESARERGRERVNVLV